MSRTERAWKWGGEFCAWPPSPIALPGIRPGASQVPVIRILSNVTAEPRNLLEGWCPEGATLAAAAAAIPPAAHEERARIFSGQDTDEARAAVYLHLLTGNLPRLEDTDGRQRAVDLTLHDQHGLAGIVEVTSTIDGGFQRNSAQLRRLVENIDHRYPGSGNWALGFEHGWTMPPNRDLPGLTQQLSEALARSDDEVSAHAEGAVEIGDKVIAYPIASQSTKRVRLSSWSANIPASPEIPYLDRLTAYLHTSDLIAKKLEKLTAEQARLGSSQQHLYLLMASTGEAGGLLPASPSFFTWGDFSCPPPVTDLWLDGGVGEMYHWNAVDGWIFHRLGE